MILKMFLNCFKVLLKDLSFKFYFLNSFNPYEAFNMSNECFVFQFLLPVAQIVIVLILTTLQEGHCISGCFVS